MGRVFFDHLNILDYRDAPLSLGMFLNISGFKISGPCGPINHIDLVLICFYKLYWFSLRRSLIKIEAAYRDDLLSKKNFHL